MANSHGVATYVPAPSVYLSSYGLLSFAQAANWDEWLQAQLQ